MEQFHTVHCLGRTSGSKLGEMEKKKMRNPNPKPNKWCLVRQAYVKETIKPYEDGKMESIHSLTFGSNLRYINEPDDLGSTSGSDLDKTGIKKIRNPKPNKWGLVREAFVKETKPYEAGKMESIHSLTFGSNMRY